MSEARRNVLVGLFMVGGLGALGFLMVMFGEAPSWLGGAEYDLNIEVKEIAGVDEGTPIYLNGINIGRVASLSFKNPNAPAEGVVVAGKIKRRFDVPLGATAECIGPALGFGRGRVEIFAEGVGMERVEPKGTITGVTVNPLQDIIPETMLSSLEGTVIKIGDFAEELTPVAQDLHEILKKTPVSEVDDPAAAARQITGNLYTAIQRLDHVLKHFDDVLGDPAVKSAVREAIDNVLAMSADGKAAFADLRDTSANLKTDMSRVADNLDEAVDNFEDKVDQFAEAAMPILDDTARTSANLSVISSNLLEGKGTLGRLLTDDRLYEVLILSLDRARDLIDTLRRLFSRFEKKGRIGLDTDGLLWSKKVPQGPPGPR